MFFCVWCGKIIEIGKYPLKTFFGAVGCCRILQRKRLGCRILQRKGQMADCWGRTDSHWRRNSFMTFFCPQNFVHPTLSLRTISESLSDRQLRTQSQNEETQREVGWELAGNFVLTSRIRSRIFWGRHEGGHEFCHEIAPKFFSPFSLPQKIHFKSTPLSGPKSLSICISFPQWFLWVLDPGLRPCFWMPEFLC